MKEFIEFKAYLFANHHIILVVRVVCIPKFAWKQEKNLRKFIRETLKDWNISLPSGRNSNSKNSWPNFPLCPT